MVPKRWIAIHVTYQNLHLNMTMLRFLIFGTSAPTSLFTKTFKTWLSETEALWSLWLWFLNWLSTSFDLSKWMSGLWWHSIDTNDSRVLACRSRNDAMNTLNIELNTTSKQLSRSVLGGCEVPNNKKCQEHGVRSCNAKFLMHFPETSKYVSFCGKKSRPAYVSNNLSALIWPLPWYL